MPSTATRKPDIPDTPEQRVVRRIIEVVFILACFAMIAIGMYSLAAS